MGHSLPPTTSHQPPQFTLLLPKITTTVAANRSRLNMESSTAYSCTPHGPQLLHTPAAARPPACLSSVSPPGLTGRFSVLHQGAVDMHAVVFLPKGYYRLSRPLVMRAAGGALVGVGTTKPAARLLLSFCCTPLSV